MSSSKSSPDHFQKTPKKPATLITWPCSNFYDRQYNKPATKVSLHAPQGGRIKPKTINIAPFVRQLQIKMEVRPFDDAYSNIILSKWRLTRLYQMTRAPKLVIIKSLVCGTSKRMFAVFRKSLFTYRSRSDGSEVASGLDRFTWNESSSSECLSGAFSLFGYLGLAHLIDYRASCRLGIEVIARHYSHHDSHWALVTHSQSLHAWGGKGGGYHRNDIAVLGNFDFFWVGGSDVGCTGVRSGLKALALKRRGVNASSGRSAN